MSELNENYILDDQFYISRDENKRYISISLQADAQGNVPEWMEVVREGNWSDFFKGDFQYTERVLDTFKSNFDNNVLRYKDGQIPFNYRHDIGGEAAGWVDKMELRNKVMQSGDIVKSFWFHVSWTVPAKEAIADHRWKYASIEDLPVWTDPETGEMFENVIFGVALTNIPFVSEIEPAMAIRLNSTQYKKKEEDDMPPENLQEIKTLTTENTTLKLDKQTLEKTNTDLSDNLTKLTKEFEDFKGTIEADKAAGVKDAEAIKMLEDGVRVSKKLNASILDDPKKTEEFKVARETPEAFKMMLSKLPVLDVATPPAGHGGTPPEVPGDGKKELTSGEFRDKALKLTKEDPALKDLKQHEAYSKAVEMLTEQGYSYTQ